MQEKLSLFQITTCSNSSFQSAYTHSNYNSFTVSIEKKVMMNCDSQYPSNFACVGACVLPLKRNIYLSY